MADKVGLAYLEKMVGNTVTVFKGGPHSDTGVLEAVRQDYLVLKTDEKGYVYFPLAHLKRIVDNTKNVTTTTTDASSEESELPIYPETFLDMVKSLRLKPVQVNDGKHGFNQGYLIDAKSEFIAYSSENDGLGFHRLDQIKSISASEVEEGEELPLIEFGGDHSFADVVGIHRHKWTTINGGPDKVEGVLVEVNDTFTVLVKNEEIIYVTNDSIHFIKQKVNNSDGDKNKQSNDKNDQSSENSNQSTDNSNQSKNNNQSNEKSKSATIKRMIIENLAKNSVVSKEN